MRDTKLQGKAGEGLSQIKLERRRTVGDRQHEMSDFRQWNHGVHSLDHTFSSTTFHTGYGLKGPG